MALSPEEIRQIATVTADEVMDRVAERETDSMLLHSVPYAYGSPGIVVDSAVARATPCRCIDYRPGKRLCFSRGIVGALSDDQEKVYCPTTVPLESPGLERRLAGWMESVETCQADIAAVPKGERLGPWLYCMSRELKARGIEASRGTMERRLLPPGGSHHSNPNSSETEVVITAKMNPGFPTAEEPRHRFDKELSEAPWRDTVGATIVLDDSAWERLRWPKELRVVISGAP
jgi:hypothetical protein